MLRRFAAGMLLLVSLAGCDAPKASTVTPPVPAPAPVVVEPPKPELTGQQALASVGPKGMCILLARAASTAERPVEPTGCAVTSTDRDVQITSGDGQISMAAPIVWQGQTVVLTKQMVSPSSVENVERGGWANVSLIVLGKAPSSGLCMDVEYFAADYQSDSIFVWPAKSAARVQLNLKPNTTKLMTERFSEPVIPAGETGAVLITPREPAAMIKSLKFVACP